MAPALVGEESGGCLSHRIEKRADNMDRKPVSVKSYANIAIVKYWGRKMRRVPSTISISLTLENMYTRDIADPLPDQRLGIGMPY